MDYQEEGDPSAGILVTASPSTPSNGRESNQPQEDGDWPTVLPLRQRKEQAKEKNNQTKGSGQVSGELRAAYQTAATSPFTRKTPIYKKLPPLPKEDFKVIVRPHKGPAIRDFTSPQLAEAVTEASGGNVSGEKFLLRRKPGSNIFIVSTPEQETTEKVRKLTSISLNGQVHDINAYLAAGEGTLKSVIHGLQPKTEPVELKNNLRITTQGVEIIYARMLEESKTAVITFYGKILPRQVYYKGVS
ncbi:hypothetical protein HPB49_012297 [Dermacentor silvarum]|uniref:Uncharacterized protein n=1 Tax=Dermacentor silvarum TaxID=543639 RepID=A0ACB8CF45_DERSI|nr:hypothetical protein HPB49_012297 [Dermacentor silvarum]